MPRTIVPPPPKRSPDETDNNGFVEDDFPTKLTKYVPAETLAFLVPAAATIGSDRNLLVVALVIAAIGTSGYLWVNARSLPPDQRPLWYFYVLSEIAFACWAVATVPSVTALVRLNDVTAGVILLFAVFLIPLLDNILTAMFIKQNKPPQNVRTGAHRGIPA